MVKHTLDAKESFLFPDSYIPTMPPRSAIDEPFVDIRPSRSINQGFNVAHSSFQTAEKTSVQVSTTSHPTEENSMGISMRLDEGLSESEVMRMLEMITPSDFNRVDLSELDDMVMEEEKSLKKIKYTVHQP